MSNFGNMIADAQERRRRIGEALWGLFVGDSLAMPAHWYYSLGNISRDFDGGVSGYADPPHPHPEAFMVGMTYRPDVKTATALGRPYDILHEHARFYDASYSPLEFRLTDRESEHGNPVVAVDERYHYHHGLRAGDNTLAAHLVRVLMRSIAKAGQYDETVFLDDFVSYLTTPGLNKDPYSEIYVRRWFENWSRGMPAYAAAEHQRRVWSIGSHGGLMRPLVVAMLSPDDYQAVGFAIEHQNLTHRSENNASALTILVPLLRALLRGDDPEAVTQHWARSIKLPKITGEELFSEYRRHGGPGGIPTEQMWRLHTEMRPDEFDLKDFVASTPERDTIRTVFANACYPEHGVPLLLSMAERHGYQPEAALLANANAGGDNVHRGMILGLVVGAATRVPDHLKDGLRDAETISGEIEEFARLAAENLPVH